MTAKTSCAGYLNSSARRLTATALAGRFLEMFRRGLRLLLQLTGDLLLAALNRVVVASAVAVLADVCTCAEAPTALSLLSKGMGHEATLACLLGGQGLSLLPIAMLAGVFRPRVLVLFAGVSFAGCVVAGYVFNLFL